VASVVRARQEQSIISGDFPSEVYSIHVNHDLQAANVDMAILAEKEAIRCGATAITRNIPWGISHFPARPRKGQPVEEVARRARSAEFLLAMREHSLHCVAYAHHADDQVETSIMRLTNGSKLWGASGMKRIRRWGMGDTADIISAGAQGMSSWVIRPLLDVPKV
jgi:tRNA(Ile)-lysidine synthase